MIVEVAAGLVFSYSKEAFLNQWEWKQETKNCSKWISSVRKSFLVLNDKNLSLSTCLWLRKAFSSNFFIYLVCSFLFLLYIFIFPNRCVIILIETLMFPHFKNLSFFIENVCRSNYILKQINRLFKLRNQMKCYKPILYSSCAVYLPIPVLQPVMRTVFPSILEFIVYGRLEPIPIFRRLDFRSFKWCWAIHFLQLTCLQNIFF